MALPMKVMILHLFVNTCFNFTCIFQAAMFQAGALRPSPDHLNALTMHYLQNAAAERGVEALHAEAAMHPAFFPYMPPGT